jgi:hypothetical protein
MLPVDNNNQKKSGGVMVVLISNYNKYPLVFSLPDVISLLEFNKPGGWISFVLTLIYISSSGGLLVHGLATAPQL